MSEPIRALATIALDVQAFEQLGPEALDRLAELVEARMSERHRGAAKRLLSVGEVAELTGLSCSLIYREIERGHLAAYRVEPAADGSRCGRELEGAVPASPTRPGAGVRAGSARPSAPLRERLLGAARRDRERPGRAA